MNELIDGMAEGKQPVLKHKFLNEVGGGGEGGIEEEKKKKKKKKTRPFYTKNSQNTNYKDI